jgi:hypothetical protein
MGCDVERYRRAFDNHVNRGQSNHVHDRGDQSGGTIERDAGTWWRIGSPRLDIFRVEATHSN